MIRDNGNKDDNESTTEAGSSNMTAKLSLPINEDKLELVG